MDEPAFPGCILHVRIIDLACLLPSMELSLSTDGYQTLSDLPKRMLEQLEEFLTAYSEQRGNDVRVRGRMQAKKAFARIKKSVA